MTWNAARRLGRRTFVETRLFGVGLNEGTMKRLIPDLHTDFIYSVVAEEYGLWLILIIIGIFAFIDLKH